MTRELTAGSLFSGIGGLCLGFEQQGIKTVWAVEKDPAAVATYKKNIPYARVIEDPDGPTSIVDVNVSRHSLEPVDIMHAGFPCQSFSIAGERKGFGDPRGQLFYEIIRILKEFGERRPAILVLENSPNIRMGDSGTWFIELAKEIKKTGYWFRESNCAEMDAFDFTPLPQKRNRLFMVALSTSAFKSGHFEFPENRSLSPKDLTKFITFNGVIEDDSYYLPEENRYHKMITGKVDDPFSIYQLRKFLVRVKDPGVCPTLTANMGLGGHNVPFIFDAKGLRKLTEHECLRLQGFPESFKFPDDVPRAKRYMQIGNSVVPSVAAILAEKVKEKIMREKK
jgi:DNA (cytosine-5)-methyltransferase 1